MPDHFAWRLLPVSAPGVPNLLVSANFAADSYSLHLTDLSNMWVESLDRKPIIKRGLVEDTTVDPSDGPDQLRRLLELLSAAFDPGEPEHSNTSLSITSDKDNSLVIHVTCILPKPLKPLKWPMHLSKCSHTALTTQLVLPLILAQQARAREVDKLIIALREKDAVIARLVNKLEVTGTGLEHVFNTLSGKRKVTRATAEEKVKGLAPFRESEFRGRMADMTATSDQHETLPVLESVFGTGGLRYGVDLDLAASYVLGDWWTKLGKGQSLTLTSRPKDKEAETPATSQTVTEQMANKDDDDDFQVQVTPPSARKRGTYTRPDVVDDDETSSGGEESDRAPEARPLSSVRTPGVSRPQMGALGGRPPDSPPRPATSLRPSPSKGKGIASSTASDTASDNDEDPVDPPPAKPAGRRSGLGRIGGKAAETAVSPQPTRSPPPGSPMVDTASPRGRKLGVIGKKSAASRSPHSESPSDKTRGRSGTPAAAVKKDTPRESSQDRADRKRADLQRELAKRAATAPAKKKRKF